MLALRSAGARGCTRRGDAVIRHEFSCGDYHDPAHMGFGPVRAINEIALPPGIGMAAERRANIDIFTWVVEGAVRYTLGDATCDLVRGDRHLVGAGRGIEVALANVSAHESARVLEVWLLPERLNATPWHGRAEIAADHGILLAANDHGLPLRRGIEAHALRLRAGARQGHACRPGQRLWLQVTRGVFEVNGVRLVAGDAAVVQNEARIAFAAPDGDAEALLLALRAG
ncbi:MAG TPA: pirin family protein [Dokdonella sp.]|uniref:pirin family protein n=1 Tax=Dokdonella sp. TaxID=2291710 RepID=UPI0025BB7C33|nr:pirin family protein [Dokdonella sp.]MBX3690775.1 pirin family protein [Dokdonella sp.]MCW5568619.1 pirin family protein [Dokdonella sp.]HNR91537.1 pirin family protein [Dokdonella sp.]